MRSVLLLKPSQVMNCGVKYTSRKIAAIRELNGWTQGGLATNAGLSVSIIQKAEAGKAVTRRTFAKIAKAFQIPIEDLDITPVAAGVEGTKALIRRSVQFGVLNDHLLPLTVTLDADDYRKFIVMLRYSGLIVVEDGTAPPIGEENTVETEWPNDDVLPAMMGKLPPKKPTAGGHPAFKDIAPADKSKIAAQDQSDRRERPRRVVDETKEPKRR